MEARAVRILAGAVAEHQLVCNPPKRVATLKKGVSRVRFWVKKIFFTQAIAPRLFGVEQKFWYLGISTARDLHAEHVFRFRKNI